MDPIVIVLISVAAVAVITVGAILLSRAGKKNKTAFQPSAAPAPVPMEPAKPRPIELLYTYPLTDEGSRCPYCENENYPNVRTCALCGQILPKS